MKPGPIMQCRLSSTVAVQLTCALEAASWGTYDSCTTCAMQ
jgi:hypothetical protein